ncbi:putative N-acetyltransferase 8B [Scyliorhinus canicula]|uniref:putative N-acetyltransferase 8B n=1 Tax=Scyliorhinus canicula TaxID=7830 RepID=UPI0018F44A68|nr:putative N-acetyltransferase 8B [Scyliorhinus canicula]XP_038644087.1 putative N-acetyltransferase 8B [Scyliorhinus canicula]XP_038644088.1 putative N-acetyltransferase 8B [Scyliorhinus canicula]
MEGRTSSEGRVVRIPGFVIRAYRPQDLRHVQRIFAEGLVDMVGPAFKRAVLAPFNVTLLLAAFGAGYTLTGSLPWAGLASLALLALVYLSCWVLYTRYVREILRGDMGDIESCYVRAPGCGFWVAEEEGREGRLAGMVAAKAQPPLACELLRLSVDRTYRRRGLAQGLTEVVLDFARGLGCAVCHLSTSNAQQPALRLYQRLGFRVVGTELPHLGPLTRLSQILTCKLERAL